MKRRLVSALIVANLAIFTLTGCASSDNFTKKTYDSGENTIDSIAIELTDREIEISASPDKRIYIDYHESEKEYYDIAVTESNGLTIKLSFDKEWTDFIGTKPAEKFRKFKIQIPNDLIKGLSAKTTNADIKISALSVTDNVSLSTNGGNIECDGISVGKTVNLTAKNGNIAGTIVGGWDDYSIECKIKKGSCNLPLVKESGEKSFYADCNNGDINIDFIK